MATIYLHAKEPKTGRPNTFTRLYEACYRGDEPAEVLPTAARERLVEDLHGKGWTDIEIATHTRMTTYTTGRIRERLGLAPHHTAEEAAA